MRTEPKKKITIMGLLADCSTDEARKLLKKYGVAPAKNKAELELRLAELYKNCDDKRQLEKDFAQIHPHKEFLTKYLLPKTPTPKEIVVEDLSPAIPTPLPDETKVVPELMSNCSGTKCTCNEKYSGADGTNSTQSSNSADKDKLIVYGMFGIVSILALVLISQQLKK